LRLYDGSAPVIMTLT